MRRRDVAAFPSHGSTRTRPAFALTGWACVRNINNVLTLYQMMINENKALEGTAKLLTPGYVQHNPLIADGSAALGKYFAGVKAAHPSAHVVVHKIIAVGDYVFAHVNFVNLLRMTPTTRVSLASTSTR
jgi:predicted SnoaL-like aldol condensation-catalyzing enzyme